MYNLKPTFKSALNTPIKIIILIGVAYFIFDRLVANKELNIMIFYNRLKDIFTQNKAVFLLILSLGIVNWLLEITKWQILVSTLQKISFRIAEKQCLSALTASLLTPNRSGDYVAKSLYFNKTQTKKITALNAIGHGLQLGITLIFGLVGLFYLNLNYPIKIFLNIKIIFGILAFIAIVLSLKIGRYYLQKLLLFYKNISIRNFFKVGVLSLGRYLVFSHQYYFLLLLFGLQMDYFTTMMAIFSMYLLASFLPSLSLTDWVVKGSAAIFIFGFLKVPVLLVLQVSLTMWILNFALPAVIGSFYIINFKVPKKLITEI